MKIKNILNIKILIILFIILIPLALFAAEGIKVDVPEGLVGFDTATVNINVVIQNVIGGILGVLGSITLLMFIVGGIMFIAAGGNQEMITKAKAILEWTLKGMFIILISYSVIVFIFNTIVGGGGGQEAEETGAGGPTCPCINQEGDNGSDCDNTTVAAASHPNNPIAGVYNCADYNAQTPGSWACAYCIWTADGPDINYIRGLCPSVSNPHYVCTKISD